MFDKELMKQLTTIPVQNREEWFAERDKLETLAVEMTRINAKDMVQKYGIARVLRVLAATIKQNPNDYDAEMWFSSTIHRAYVQDLFRQYANLRKL